MGWLRPPGWLRAALKTHVDVACMARQFLGVQADKGTPVASALGQAGAASTAHTGGSVETATRERTKKDKKEKKVCQVLK